MENDHGDGAENDDRKRGMVSCLPATQLALVIRAFAGFARSACGADGPGLRSQFC